MTKNFQYKHAMSYLTTNDRGKGHCPRPREYPVTQIMKPQVDVTFTLKPLLTQKIRIKH